MSAQQPKSGLFNRLRSPFVRNPQITTLPMMPIKLIKNLLDFYLSNATSFINNSADNKKFYIYYMLFLGKYIDVLDGSNTEFNNTKNKLKQTFIDQTPLIEQLANAVTASVSSQQPIGTPRQSTQIAPVRQPVSSLGIPPNIQPQQRPFPQTIQPPIPPQQPYQQTMQLPMQPQQPFPQTIPPQQRPFPQTIQPQQPFPQTIQPQQQRPFPQTIQPQQPFPVSRQTIMQPQQPYPLQRQMQEQQVREQIRQAQQQLIPSV